MADAPTPTVSSLQTVHQPHGQVAFGSEFGRLLPHVNHHFCKALALVELDQNRRTSDEEEVHEPERRGHV